MSLFQKVKGNLTEEMVNHIVKTGEVPSNLKSNEDKVYYVTFRSYLIILNSQMAEDYEIHGETIITEGRKNTFNMIKDYLDNDAALAVDIRTSFVMVEGVDAGKHISLYRFIKLCNKAYPEEAYDEDKLESYLKDFYDEDEFRDKENKAIGLGGNAGTLMNEKED